MEEDPKDLAFQTVQDAQAFLQLYRLELRCSFRERAFEAVVVRYLHPDEPADIDGLGVGSHPTSLIEAIRIALNGAMANGAYAPDTVR